MLEYKQWCFQVNIGETSMLVTDVEDEMCRWQFKDGFDISSGHKRRKDVTN